MRIIFDARILTMYPVGLPGFTGGTEHYLRVVAHGLAERGHTVHVVTPDLGREEQRGPAEWWWPPYAFPRDADAVVLVQGMKGLLEADYQADRLIVMTNGIDPNCGPGHEWASGVDAWPCFSKVHVDMLCGTTPTVRREACFVTGLGVDLPDLSATPAAVPSRLFFSNDPARGLWHMLDIFACIRRQIPDATLHVGYDFDRQFELHRWVANSMSEALWEARERLESDDGVVKLPRVDRADVAREMAQCAIHVMPSDPPGAGTQIHGMTQMEIASYGVPLVLSDVEAFPEVFGQAASILPLPGRYYAAEERRIDSRDWADAVVEILKDPEKRAEMGRRSRALAEHHTWTAVLDRWEEMLGRLTDGR
jgi:glycosyltransferase involved in cell wall biosynthesis